MNGAGLGEGFVFEGITSGFGIIYCRECRESSFHFEEI